MSSKRNARRRICESKRGAWDTPGPAWRMARIASITTWHDINAYRCVICGKWHIGHRQQPWANYHKQRRNKPRRRF